MGNGKALYLDVSTLCQMLSSSEAVCPFSSVSENLVCFESSKRASKHYGSEHVKTNVCQNWSSITFTKVKGRQCIQNKLKPEKKSDANVKSVCSQIENITLHQACKDGNITAVRCFLLEDKTDINSRGEFGQTPAMVAVRNSHFVVFDLLVRNGCDLSLLDDFNNTILHVACRGGNTYIIKKLIDTLKFDMESKGEFGMTPVMYAAYTGQRLVFHLLRRKGCNLTVIDYYKNNLIHVSCIGGNLALVRYIVSVNVISTESRGMVGRTPVMMSALKGHINVFRFLKNRGCNVTVLDQENNTVLHLACIGGNVNMVRHIVSLDILNIDSRGLIGRTPVMTAAVKGHRDVVAFLVSIGCDMQLVDDENSTAIHMACISGDVDTVKCIMALNVIDLDTKGYGGRTPIMIAAMENQRDVFDLLARAGCSLTAVDNQRSNLLHLVCFFGPVSMVNYIISLNISGVVLEGRDQLGRTPVMLAAASGKMKIFQILVRKGCNLKTVDIESNTILHLACHGGNVHIVKFVLKLEDVKMNWKNKYNQTPAQLARGSGHTAVINLCRGRRSIK